MEALANGGQAAPLRVYAPVKDARKKVFETAAASRSVRTYGVTAEGALAAPGELIFGRFIQLPEALEIFGPPEDGDAALLLFEFREEFKGGATRRMLIDFVRARHSGKPRGFRYWNNLGAAIWKIYAGVRDGKLRTGKAHEAEVERYLNAAKRAGKEEARLALRRVPKNRADKRMLETAKRQNRIDWLRSRAVKKRGEAEKLLETAQALETEAARIESEIDRL